MSRLLLFTALAVTAFTSCSVYRSGQTKTPDDVYYSPAREGAAYVETEKKQRDGYYRADDYSSDDRWLRMRVRDRYRWSAFDDYDWNYNSWAYSPYGYNYNPYWNYGYGFNNYFTSYWNWNSRYNPYCGGVIIVNPKVNQPAYTAVRNFSLDRYTNTNYNNANRPLSASKTGLRYGAPSYNNRNTTTNSSLGSSIRKVFSNDNNSSSRNSYYSPSSSDSRPTRTYTPSESSSTRSYTPSSSSSSSSSSGSSSGGSSGGGGVSRPSRGN